MNMATQVADRRPIANTGIGLRAPHIQQVLMDKPNIAWFELLADNHLSLGGLNGRLLDAVADHYPITLHGVGLSLGSVDELDLTYLKKLKLLQARTKAHWISEHLCFTSMGGHYSHDLMPMPQTDESVIHMAKKISQAQDFLGERILVENVSNYIAFEQSTLSEVEFLTAVAETADCDLLVDVNNIYVNEVNHGLCGQQYLLDLPLHRVKEIHLAGYEQMDGYLLDAHNNRVSDEVWVLYEQLMKLCPDVPSLIEWDNDIPELSVLMEEADKANRLSKITQRLVC